jgi:hypothetical protein
MKSVTLVAFIGSWFCSSLTSKLRKSVDDIVVEDELEDEVADDVAVVELVAETVMANSGISARRRMHLARCARDLACQSNGRRAEFRRKFIGWNALIRRQNLPPRRDAGRQKSPGASARKAQPGAIETGQTSDKRELAAGDIQARNAIGARSGTGAHRARARRPYDVK